MRSHLCAIHFVYVSWLKKRNNTASWLDGILVISLIVLLNLLLIIGLINPQIIAWIFNQGKLTLCIAGIVIYILFIALLTCALGERQHYNHSVRKAFSRFSKKVYFMVTMSWMCVTTLLFFSLPILIAK